MESYDDESGLSMSESKSPQDRLSEHLSNLGISLDDEALERLVQYWDLVLETNKVVNLVSRKCTYFHGLEVHLADSLAPLGLLDFPVTRIKVLDFGSGPGLPGIPLKIARPNWRVYLCEPQYRKTRFIERFISKTLLKEVLVFPHFVHENGVFNEAESNNPSNSNISIRSVKFDLVTVRAVSSIKDIVSRVFIYTKRGGHILFYKGPNYKNELIECKDLFAKQNLEVVDVKQYHLKMAKRTRNLILIKKIV
jgi:16S rRNA (guanine527-N7)-methyltransferase